MNKTEYLAAIAERKNGKSKKSAQNVINLKMPSGVMWKVLPISLEAYLVAGKLPLHLLANLKSAKDLQISRDKMLSEITGEDIVNLYGVIRDVMLSNVIEPKIALTETDDALSPEQIDPEDFEFFRNWVLSGGQTQIASSFRTKTARK